LLIGQQHLSEREQYYKTLHIFQNMTSKFCFFTAEYIWLNTRGDRVVLAPISAAHNNLIVQLPKFYSSPTYFLLFWLKILISKKKCHYQGHKKCSNEPLAEILPSYLGL
jgi:hypothetical protein